MVCRNVDALFKLVTDYYVTDERADSLFDAFLVDSLNCMGVRTDLLGLTAGAAKAEEACAQTLAVVDK